MAETNMVIDNLVDIIMSNKHDNIRDIITSNFPFGDGLICDIEDIIKQVSKEIIIPNYLENVDKYTEALSG
jgi:hypothetical protein